MTNIQNTKHILVIGYLPCGISTLANLPKAGFHRVKIWDLLEFGAWNLIFKNTGEL